MTSRAKRGGDSGRKKRKKGGHADLIGNTPTRKRDGRLENGDLGSKFPIGQENKGKRRAKKRMGVG